MTKENNVCSEVTINGVTYVPKVETDPDWVMVRSRDAGVFAGELQFRDGDEVHLRNARRIWRWEGAATLSQLALEGTSKPGSCKFPAPLPEIVVLGVCEVIPMTPEAVASIVAVKVWSA